MKIVQVMPEFGLAGAETMCETLTYELRSLGHEVVVISLYDYHSAITDRMENAGVRIYYLHKKSGLDLSMIRKIWKVLREIKPDVVHTHLYSAQYAVPASILAGVKRRVHTVHNLAKQENGRMARNLNKFFFKFCHLKLVALSDLVRGSIVREYKTKVDCIPVVFNGVDLSKCLPKTEYRATESFKIVHIGRFSQQKNHLGLLQAFRLFCSKHPESQLWLIGDGEKRAEIQEWVCENGLTQNVRFLGLQTSVYRYLHEADLFTLPSHYEGMPMTLIEAMGTGLPIVATAVGGIPDMLTNEENALLTENDPKVLAQAYERLFGNLELRQAYGQGAKQRAIVFSSKNMAKEYQALYQA